MKYTKIEFWVETLHKNCWCWEGSLQERALRNVRFPDYQKSKTIVPVKRSINNYGYKNYQAICRMPLGPCAFSCIHSCWLNQFIFHNDTGTRDLETSKQVLMDVMPHLSRGYLRSCQDVHCVLPSELFWKYRKMLHSHILDYLLFFIIPTWITYENLIGEVI